MSDTSETTSVGPVIGILDTTRPDPTTGGCQPFGLELLAADGTLVPQNWMTAQGSFELRHDGTGWVVTGGLLSEAMVHRLARTGNYAITVPTLFCDEDLDPAICYQLMPVPGPEPSWILARTASPL
ncbi:hypothetical protein Lfu02_40650 [Longispora fulva]|uniref:Uncharacterized protein n=1 Tax=Longispora fulva TaxID=619741 RepID=A0A8J7GHQ6_9ACTN|nr:hypothetical protein [Longispora fulva]MBG6136523.1 hypothetical protein [Longispora fulva]GIG59693.1 hypothetical protein Lfu02_40650 [Longispora fulva]